MDGFVRPHVNSRSRGIPDVGNARVMLRNGSKDFAGSTQNSKTFACTTSSHANDSDLVVRRMP